MEEKMSKSYEPENEFVDRLEWQLSSEFRRADRMKPPTNRIPVPRSIMAVALIFGILTTSVTVVKATEYFRDSWKKKLEIAKLETDVAIKKARLESIREMAAQTETRHANGLIDDNERMMMTYAVDRAELALKQSQVNLDEVYATGDAPDNSLYAPVVGSRDFVSERLQLEIEAAKLDNGLSQRQFQRAQQQILTGILRESELGSLQAAMAGGEAHIEKLQKQLRLRAQFMRGELSARQIEIAGRLSDAQRNLHAAKQRMSILESQLERQKELESQGFVSSMELKQLGFVLQAAEAELKLANLEIQILEKVK
jgi:multidrug resistance efflux pump